MKAFRDYMPVTYSSSRGIYRSFRWGKNLEVFLLDERSFRSAKASANHQCDDRNGNPDLGPTAPQSARNTFAAIYPALSDPPKAGCVEKINDPSRTMLGSSQFTRFTNAVKASTATFKVIMNEVPIQQFYSLPYDRWEGYEAERRRLMDFIANNAVKNTVFLTTDVHANLVNTIKFSTLGENGPAVDTGIFDVTTGPVATMTYNKEVATALGSEGAANLFRAVVLQRWSADGRGHEVRGRRRVLVWPGVRHLDGADDRAQGHQRRSGEGGRFDRRGPVRAVRDS